MKRMVMRTHVDNFIIELNDTEAADAIWLGCPMDSTVNQWGGELFIDIPVDAPLENGRREFDAGEVAYWPSVGALCLFFGPTPLSTGERAVVTKDLTPVGRFVGKGLDRVGDRTRVRFDTDL